MNWASNVDRMLLRTYKHYHAETFFIFTGFALFVSMSRPRSYYVVFMWSIFIFTFIFNMINRMISWIKTHLLFCLFFRVCTITFGLWRGWKMWIIFKYQKFSPRVFLSICLIFCQFQPGVVYKSVAYKKACFSFALISSRESSHTSNNSEPFFEDDLKSEESEDKISKIKESNSISFKMKNQKEQPNLEQTIIGWTKSFIKNNLAKKLLKQKTEMMCAMLHSFNHNFDNNSSSRLFL